MMDREKLFQVIDSLNPEYVGMWEDVCNLESPTEDKPGVDAVGECFMARAREKGWQVEVNPQEKAGNPVCIVMNPDAAGQRNTFPPMSSPSSPARMPERRATSIECFRTFWP